MFADGPGRVKARPQVKGNLPGGCGQAAVLLLTEARSSQYISLVRRVTNSPREDP